MLIKNRKRLATDSLRKAAVDIIEAGIDSVLPHKLISSSVSFNPQSKVLQVLGHDYHTSQGRIFVIGGGKAANMMAETIEQIIGYKNITAGIVNCKSTKSSTRKIKTIKAGHPIPDKKGIDGVRQMLALKKNYFTNEQDSVICLVSGGGSALMPCPATGISLEDQQNITTLLLKSGADIHEINTVRKHLSQTKGGKLGEYFSPARIISLIISDVVGDDLSVIASGPTYPDSSTFQDAHDILKKYDLLKRVPPVINHYLRLGCSGLIEETPKSLNNCHNCIIGNNRIALEAMAAKASEMGFNPLILTAEQKGETGETALSRAKEIIDGKYNDYNAILLGGETTPAVPEKSGKGGRNQHYAAVSVLAMKEYPGKWLAASVGTDGSDYISDVAGAMVTDESSDIAESTGLKVQSYIDRFDSHMLLKKLGGSLIETGSTGTNVSDVILYLLGGNS
jgi:glycerate 2-kinase